MWSPDLEAGVSEIKHRVYKQLELMDNRGGVSNNLGCLLS